MDEARPAVPAIETGVADLLRQCVQCGLCLPHCATFLGTGNEVQSPRGRLILLAERDAASAAEAADSLASFRQAFDHCIGCRACETACPSGVPFTLLEEGQRWASDHPSDHAGDRGPFPRAAVPAVLLRRLDRPGFLAALSRVAGFARAMAGLVGGRQWRRRWTAGPAGRVARLLGSVPDSPRSDRDLMARLDRLCGFDGPTLERLAAGRGSGPPVSFFRGCANAGLLSGTSRRLRDLLQAANCQVEEPDGQACCGALAAHTGQPGRAAQLRNLNREALGPGMQGGRTVVVEAAGCGHQLQTYDESFATGVTDAIVFLTGLDLPELGSVPLKVAYHDPCHARHGQGIVAEPRRLLRAIPGLDLVEPAEAEVCCGSGGAWGLRYPELSEELGRRKAANLVATGADLVVTCNPGCQGQIADALAVTAPAVPILPLTDLLWYAACRGARNRAAVFDRPSSSSPG